MTTISNIEASSTARLVSRGQAIGRAIVVNGLLILFAAIVLAPFMWMILTSIRDPADIFTRPFALEGSVISARENYGRALTVAPIMQFMLNGLIVVCGVLIVQLATSVMAAYALAKLEFHGRNALFMLVLFALCIPIQVPALPIYLGLAKLGLIDSYFAMMFPWFFSVFAIFLFRQHFRSFPDEIVEAARLDGFTEIEILARLILPGAMPAIAAFSVFSVTAHWNDLYWPMIVVTSVEKMTPPLGLLFFRDAETGTSYGALMAATTIVTIPLILIFMVAQRQFVEGVTMKGIK